MDEDLEDSSEGSGSRSGEGSHTHKNSVTFQPPSLDFKEHPLGMPNLQRVSIYNTNSQKSIQMFSISGNTVHFHCSFFQDKVLPPLTNTTFDVVFLAREEGRIDSLLYIHTSVGTFKYQVKGVGIPNPYRLRPFVGVRVPLNSSYAPLINMHNPHGSMLQVVEMYSSGGDLHLELPTGELDGPKKLWEIPPYETRPVMRANFVAHVESNHTSYIRIKTNNTSQEYLVLPVEVEVSSQPGLYCPQELLDFGIMTTSDAPRTLRLLLLNSGQKNIHIQTLVVAPVNDAVKVEYRPIKLPPDTTRATVVATVTFDASKVVHLKQSTGRIVIKSKNNQFKVSVPYKVQVLEGELEYNSSFLRFYVGEDPTEETKSLLVSNRFSTTVVLHNVTIPEKVKQYFVVKSNTPLVLLPGESGTLIQLSLHLERVTPNFQLSSSLLLHTNVSKVHIPIVCYNGKLTKFIPPSGKEDMIEFGTLGIGSKKDMFFTVINDNPIELRLRGWGTNLTRGVVELIGVEKGNASVIIRRRTFLDMARSLFLKPYHYAVFRIGVTAPDTEGFTVGEAYVQTQYEQLKVPFGLRTAEGSLTTIPEYIAFDNAYPGKVSVQKLHIYSSFRHPMVVTNVSAQPHDARFYFRPVAKSEALVQPQVKSHIGMLYFDPQRECGDSCYAGFTTSSKAYHQWAQGFSLPSSVREWDSSLSLHLRSLYLAATAEKSSFNVTFQLDSSEVHGFLFQAQATLQWPSLLGGTAGGELSFPLTQVGNVSVKEYILHNAGQKMLLVQVVPVTVYPGGCLLPEHLLHADKDDCDESGFKVFSFPDLVGNGSGDSVRLSRQKAEELLGVKPHKDTAVFLLPPGAKLKNKVAFSPHDEISKMSMLLLRNNLTGLEVLYLRGRGGFGQFKFGNKKPDSSSPLLFEISERHLKDCERGKSSQYLPPNLTVKISFIARNIGELPIYVSGFDINDSPCEGYGFRVLNCQGFELPANGSRKVDIAFTPDFTLSKVERVLQVHTSLTPNQVLNYSLVAMVPAHMLSVCSNALPRPSWETLLYYVMVSFMIFLLFAIVGAAIFESDRLAKATYVAMTTSTPPADLNPPSRGSEPSSASNNNGFDKSRVLDLRTVKQKVDNRFAKSEVRNGHASSPPKGKDSSKANRSYTSSTNKPSYDRQSSSEKEMKANSSNSTKDWDTESETASSSSSCSKAKKNSAAKCSPYRDDKKAWENVFSPSEEKKEGKKCKGDSGRRNSIEADLPSSEEKKRKKGKAAEVERKREKLVTEEETSSTTTEGSNPDEVGEKECKTTESRSKEKSPKQHEPKPKTKASESSSVPLAENNEVEDTEAGFKSRSHKKAKLDSASKVYAGDILQPSSLELPYKLKPLKEAHHEKGKDGEVQKVGGKKAAKVKGVSQSAPLEPTSTTSTANAGRESPPSLWDHPGKKSAEESLIELAAQTESFALLSTQMDPLPSKPAGTSYSSIVTSGEKHKAKVSPPVGKILPEVKKVEPKQLGPIGQRPQRKWGRGGDGGGGGGGGGGLQYIESMAAGDAVMQGGYGKEEEFCMAGQMPVGGRFVSPMAATACMNDQTYSPLGQLWDKPSNTIMQMLQAERRQRVEEFQRQQALQRIISADAWPGFNTSPPTPDILWDSMFASPAAAAPQGGDVSVRNNPLLESMMGGGVGGVNPLWAASAGWNPLQQRQQLQVQQAQPQATPSPPPGIPTTSSIQVSPAPMVAVAATSEVAAAESEVTAPILEPPLDGQGFDPFRSLSDIWAPRARDSTDSWSSFFSSKEN